MVVLKLLKKISGWEHLIDLKNVQDTSIWGKKNKKRDEILPEISVFVAVGIIDVIVVILLEVVGGRIYGALDVFISDAVNHIRSYTLVNDYSGIGGTHVGQDVTVWGRMAILLKVIWLVLVMRGHKAVDIVHIIMEVRVTTTCKIEDRLGVNEARGHLQDVVTTVFDWLEDVPGIIPSGFLH